MLHNNKQEVTKMQIINYGVCSISVEVIAVS
jgi:hypothetical protein